MGDLLFDSISGGKWCPLGHTSPTVKHTPATESKVHNGEGPYLHPDLRFSRSLHHGEARLGHESKVHNSEGPYSHSDFRYSSFCLGAVPSENRTFPSPKFIHKRFAWLINPGLLCCLRWMLLCWIFCALSDWLWRWPAYRPTLCTVCAAVVLEF